MTRLPFAGRLGFTLLLAWLVLSLGLGQANAEDDADFRIVRAELSAGEEDYLLDADIDYQFGESVTDALKNGVPLTLLIRFKLKREREYWFDETIASVRRRLHIRFHPLAKVYQMAYEDTDAPKSFTSIKALLAEMGAIRHWAVVRKDEVEAGETYQAALSVSLDMESLPLPLRPLAYVTPDWYLTSSWRRWSFEKSE
jgi:hypothetical protein